MYDPRFTRLVRILTEGCTRAGAYERLYADIQPRRQGWARRGRCGDPSRSGGVILCEKHPEAACLFLPYSWKSKAS
jgi:hypothetical protein